MNKQDLIYRFEEAIKQNIKFAGVKVTVPGCEKEEIIINPQCNLKKKLEYYKNAYNDNLELKAFNEIKITGFVYGNNYIEIGSAFVEL